jgi:hypothetical protein
LLIGALLIGGLAALSGVFSTTPRETKDAFSVPTLVGQPAPEFTALGADGKPVTVKPGDGRAKALVFYMGFR